MLRAENTTPRVCGIFYKATVHYVLIFGHETWNLSPLVMEYIEGLHIPAAQHMSGNMHCKNYGGSWTYPSSEDILEDMCVFTVGPYIGVRRHIITNFITNGPIFELCQDVGRKSVTSSCQCWWDQPMDLNMARASDGVDVDDDRVDDTIP